MQNAPPKSTQRYKRYLYVIVDFDELICVNFIIDCYFVFYDEKVTKVTPFGRLFCVTCYTPEERILRSRLSQCTYLLSYHALQVFAFYLPILSAENLPHH